MAGMKNETLLADNRVQEEIARHRWIESEKAGADIGFERAAKDWLTRFSDEWIKYNLSQKRASGRGTFRVLSNGIKSGRAKS